MVKFRGYFFQPARLFVPAGQFFWGEHFIPPGRYGNRGEAVSCYQRDFLAKIDQIWLNDLDC